LSIFGDMTLPNPWRLPLVASCLLGAVLAPEASALSTILIDFGMTSGHAQGSPTASPDTNGVYWNNATSTSHGAPIAGGTGLSLPNLVTTTNIATTVSLGFSPDNGTADATDQQWLSAGRANGGLIGSNPGLAIDGITVGVQTATEDYFFSEIGPATLTISGLNPNWIYDLSMFATRNTTEVRITTYTVTDLNGVHVTTLQTSGTDLGGAGYHGNRTTIAGLDGLVPTAAGTLTMTIEGSGANPRFGYLGVLGISVPEPGSALLVCLSGLGLISRRRRPDRR
jgi:hypothetical protein